MFIANNLLEMRIVIMEDGIIIMVACVRVVGQERIAHKQKLSIVVDTAHGITMMDIVSVIVVGVEKLVHSQ